MTAQVSQAVAPAAKEASQAVAPAAKEVARAVTPAATQVARAVTPAARAVGESASQAAQRMKRYLEDKETLKTFHDAGAHGEAALLAFLRSAGSAPGRSPRDAEQAPRSAAPPASVSAPAPVARTYNEEPLSLPPADLEASPSAPFKDGWRWPVDAGIVSSEYGPRWGRQHSGIDIAARIGEPVFACADGEVIYSGSGLSGYGNIVIVRHGDGRTSLYAHNSELRVSVGAQVRGGTLIALIGNTGRSTGPHLHFEIRQGQVSIDPRTLLPPSKLAGVHDPAILFAQEAGERTIPRMRTDSKAFALSAMD